MIDVTSMTMSIGSRRSPKKSITHYKMSYTGSAQLLNDECKEKPSQRFTGA